MAKNDFHLISLCIKVGYQGRVSTLKTSYFFLLNYKCLRILKGQSKMDNPEKLATKGSQDEDKQNKNTTHYVLETTIRKQTEIT